MKAATSLYLIEDYTEAYKPIMQFNNNKTAFIHRWYPFVEGYSKEFINSIVEEIDYEPHCALDPFAGSGTTPVELQSRGIKCYSFEVSPFMHLLSKVKMLQDYSTEDFTNSLIVVGQILKNYPQDIRKIIPPPIAQTIDEKDSLKKWIFNREVMDGLLDIKLAIRSIRNRKYENLFKVALASILLEVSNVYRNGKCVSYKKDWQNLRKISREEVHSIFLNKLTGVIQQDIELLENSESTLISNYEFCYLGDVRALLKTKVSDKTIDLVITSPPYLNSRDYTDIYIVELWMLDLINSYESIRQLREATIRSHVQIQIGKLSALSIDLLAETLKKLNFFKETFWNKELPNMINGYFHDMDTLFALLKAKIKPGKRVYFNVANSAYYGIEIRVDEIVSMIAEKNGFYIEAIRKARDLKTSSQQKEQIGSLRESVIVMVS